MNERFSFSFSDLEKAALAGLIFTVLVSIVNFAGICETLRNKIFRIHIIANSDSEQDQALKFKVRDRILQFCGEQNFKNLEEFTKFAIANKDEIESMTREEIIKHGFNYGAQASVEYGALFGTRFYENFTLPAGRYRALKLKIGEGRGKNFWCVAFPISCIPAAQENYDLNYDLNENFSFNEIDLIENEPKYEIKFKIVEIFECVRQYIFDFFESIFL
jgi:stage II sporulation protein R